MGDNLSNRGNLELGLLRRIAPRNDILISYGLDESSPYIETIKILFYAYVFLWADIRSAPTYYLLLITDFPIRYTLNLS